jgi:hypothetical protein
MRRLQQLGEFKTYKNNLKDRQPTYRLLECWPSGWRFLLWQVRFCVGTCNYSRGSQIFIWRSSNYHPTEGIFTAWICSTTLRKYAINTRSSLLAAQTSMGYNTKLFRSAFAFLPTGLSSDVHHVLLGRSNLRRLSWWNILHERERKEMHPGIWFKKLKTTCRTQTQMGDVIWILNRVRWYGLDVFNLEKVPAVSSC